MGTVARPINNRRKSTRNRRTRSVSRPTLLSFDQSNIDTIITDEEMRQKLGINNGQFFEMKSGNSAPLDYNNNNYDYYFWKNGAWSPYTGKDNSMLPGYYVRTEKQNPSRTSETSGTTTPNTFNGLFLGTPLQLSLLTTTPLYNLKWYLDNIRDLNEYLNLGDLYNNVIKNQNLDYTGFLALLRFLNPNIYKGMDTNGEHGIEEAEYDKFMLNTDNRKKFYNVFNVSNDSWLSDQGKQYFNFFNKENGLDKIQAYNDYLRMLYGADGIQSTSDDNIDVINYLINNTPASPGDDKYKLGKAYNEALQKAVQSGDYTTARRLSLYMNQQGINHYGYSDHFDLGHLLGRWNRKLSNGQTAGLFLDWIYELNKKTPLDSLLLYDIIRKTTKWNFDLNDNFWNSLGDRAKAYDLKNKYAQSHQPNFKEGGQIFRMLFV